MPNTIQVKRGLEANRTAVTPAAGEFLYTTDTKRVFIGDGATAGGNQVGASGAYTEYLNRSTDITLTAANVGKIIVEPTVSIMVQLPNATTLQQGNTFEITNMSEQVNMFVRSSDGTYQAFVAAGQTVNITAENVSTAAGVWVADNPNYGLSTPISFGVTQSPVGTVTPHNSATAAISATKMIRVISSGTNFNGVTATIITKSGSTITKGRQQFLFNFSANSPRVGPLNVVMTSATTGIISAFADASSGLVSNVLLYTFSIDANDNVSITGGAASFDANPSSSGANSIAITVLSSTAAVVVYHSSGFMYSRVLTLSGGVITDVGTQTGVPWAGSPASSVTQYPQLIALSSTLVVAAYINTPGLEVAIVVGIISGSTISWGTEVSPFITNSNGWQFSLSRLSSTEFIFAMGDSGTIRAYYGSVSGSTITLGAQYSNTPSGAALFSMSSYPISSTAAVISWYDTGGGFNKPYAAVLTKSGTSLTKGSNYVLSNSPTPVSSPVVPFSLKGFAAFNAIPQPSTDLYMDYMNFSFVYAVPMSVSGTVITPGTGLLVTEEFIAGTPSICTLSKTRAIAFVAFTIMSDGTSGSRLYLIDTSGARPVVLTTSSTISTAFAFCAGQLTSTRALIAYATSSNAQPTIRTVDITGDTFTFNASITGTPAIGPRPAICKISQTKAMLYVQNTTSNHRIYNIAISGTTLTESPSFVTTWDNSGQSFASRRLLYNVGNIGYYFAVSSNTGTIQTFNVIGTSPQNISQGTTTASSGNMSTYNSIIAPGTMIGLGPLQSGSLGPVIYSGAEGTLQVIYNCIPPNVGSGAMALPFNQNSIMIIGNSTGYLGKLSITPASASVTTNSTILPNTQNFLASNSMHCNIQDWVDGDNFVPNSNKILFFGRNNVNLLMELYHAFDKGAAQ